MLNPKMMSYFLPGNQQLQSLDTSLQTTTNFTSSLVAPFNRLNQDDVGIHAMEIYFPSTYVDQGDLEVFDKASKGKYTIGLGQLKMACVNDCEDVNSISLTCVRNLLQKYNIPPTAIGRLEVGTETILDKSKSVKTVLMDLFKASGNHDIEGVTTFNACYGGTNALFNTINWVQSKGFDGRYGLVLCTDVAVYPKGNARPTGGCGAIAMLIGPKAPLIFEDVRSSFIDNNYDFYKPNPNSEYPTVDGHLSINIYLGALASCFNTLKAKHLSRFSPTRTLNYHDFDYFCFHTPFSKMVQKSFFHLILEDIKTSTLLERYPQAMIAELNQTPKDKWKVDDPKVLKILMQYLGNSEWQDKCERNLFLAKNLGNIYTGSLYNGLLSLLLSGASKDQGGEGLDLRGKRIMMFSYGSGCAASMFSIKVSQNGWDYRKVIERSNFKSRLDSRVKISPEEFDQWMLQRELNYGKQPPTYKPTGSIEHLFEGTYYLTYIDDKYKRTYAVKGQAGGGGLQEVKIGGGGGIESAKTSSTDDIETTPSAVRLNAMKMQLLASQSKNEAVTQSGPGTNNNQAQANAILDHGVLRSVQVNFHKKPLQERLNELTKLYPILDTDMLLKGGLKPEIADYMIENCIGVLPLPLGLGLGFKINNRPYIIPMAIEEPSVIAAASAMGKLISDKGTGFMCQSTPPVMIAQIQVTEVRDTKDAQYKIKAYKKEIIKHANQYCENMVKRGGGVEDIRIRHLGDQMIVVELLVNVCDSMGANVVNTIAEQTSPYITQILGQGRIALRILSNLCTERLAMAEFRIPIKHMGWKSFQGKEVVDRIIEAQRFAELDQYRATTHNKGIMNGIDAVAVALGQDWRAIEAAAHSYASFGDRYGPLTRYKISKDGEYFEGRIEMPLSVGTKGGAIETNPSYINTHSILGFPTSVELGHIMVSVGLAQNLAALRALSMEGIQRGHMNLHARNVAIQAGVPQDLVPEVVEFMKMRNRINVKAAQHYLNGHQLFKRHQTRSPGQSVRDVSTFYVEIRENFLPEPLILTILLDCKTSGKAYHLSIEKEPKLNTQEAKLLTYLFGGNKGFEWMTSFLGLLQTISYTRKIPIKKDLIMTQYRLKLLTVLANFLVTNLLEFDFIATTTFVSKLVSYLDQCCASLPPHQMLESGDLEIRSLIPEVNSTHYTEKEDSVDHLVLPFGFSLLYEITYNLNVYSAADVQSPSLRCALMKEFREILHSLITSKQLFIDGSSNPNQLSEPRLLEYMTHKRKRMNFKMMVLTDCISLEEPLPDGLLDFIQQLTEIYEIRGVAYKDLQSGAVLQNNLFYFWLMSKQAGQKIALAQDSPLYRTDFFRFIENHCHQLMEHNYKIRYSPYFDQGVFDETMKFIETYYKLDPQLALLASRSNFSQSKL